MPRLLYPHRLARLSPLFALMIAATLTGCALPNLSNPMTMFARMGNTPGASAVPVFRTAGLITPISRTPISSADCQQLAAEDLGFARTAPDLNMVNAINASGTYLPSAHEMAQWRRMIAVREALYYGCRTNSAFDSLGITTRLRPAQ